MKKLEQFLNEDKEYFITCQPVITARNGAALEQCSVVYVVVLLLYTLLTWLTGQSVLLLRMYCVFDLLHLAFTAVVLFGKSGWQKNNGRVQLFCALFELEVLSFFALEGALVSPTVHSLYIPIPILLFLCLFTHGITYNCTVISLYTAGFALLVWACKEPAAANKDWYIALATFLAAMLGNALIANIRHREGMAMARYEGMSKLDGLTGLYNKVTIESICRKSIAAGRAPCALLILDLDHFKLVNDRYGHAAGDEVIRSVGQVLRQHCRPEDCAGRFGGDEFMMLFCDCGDANSVAAQANRLIGAVEALTFSTPELGVQCSVGIAVQQGGESFAALFKTADNALYAAKKQGRNRFCLG